MGRRLDGFRGGDIRYGSGGSGSVIERPLCMHDALVNGLDIFEVMVQLVKQLRSGADARPLGVAVQEHSLRDALEIYRISRQGMSLAVIFELKPVFQVAQELIGVLEARILGTRKKIFIVQASQGKQRSTVADPGFPPAVEPL